MYFLWYGWYITWNLSEKQQEREQARIQISFSGGPTENALVLLYDTLISGFQWM